MLILIIFNQSLYLNGVVNFWLAYTKFYSTDSWSQISFLLGPYRIVNYVPLKLKKRDITYCFGHHPRIFLSVTFFCMLWPLGRIVGYHVMSGDLIIHTRV